MVLSSLKSRAELCMMKGRAELYTLKGIVHVT